MPRGGARVGAGKKRALAFGRTDLDAAAKKVTIPTTLTVMERAAWRRLAPAARRMGTLVVETAPGFVLLCEAVAALEEARAVVTADGLVVAGRAHPLLTHCRQLTQRVDSLLGRYQLAAGGKAVEVPMREAPATGPASKFDFYGEARRVVERAQPLRC